MVPGVQMMNERQTAVAVGFVEFVADLPLALAGLLEQEFRKRRAVEFGREEAAGPEDAEELSEPLGGAQLLQREMLEGARTIVTVIQPKTDEIADDAPGTLRETVEIVPALLNGRPTVEAVGIEIHVRILQFDDCDRYIVRGSGEVPERPVGRSHPRYGILAFELVVGSSLGHRVVAEGFAEDLQKKIGVNRRFFSGEHPLVLEFCPLAEDGVGPFEIVFVKV